MSWFGKLFLPLARPAVWLPLSALLLPAGVWLLLAAGGIAHSYSLAETYERWFALDAGMFLCGLGVWTAPIGLGVLMHKLRAQDNIMLVLIAVLFNPWALPAALVGLSVHGAWALRASVSGPGAGYPFNTLLCAAILLLGTVSYALMGTSLSLKRLHFGHADLEPEEIKCAPGGEAAAVLTLGKAAASVEGRLELYGEGDAPLVTIPARVGPAEPASEGWAYRVTAVLPESTVMPRDGGWVLSVKARGASGGTVEESADVILRG